MMTTQMDEITFCLGRVGVSTRNRSTLVVTGGGRTERPPEAVWAKFSDVDKWPTWSPLHKDAHWTSAAGFVVGATFDQRLDLGFPVGTIDAHVVADVVVPERRVSWVTNDGGIKTCHLWQFTPLSGGGTTISNVEIFSGRFVPVLAPLVRRRWNALFQGAVDGLIAALA